MFEAATGSTAPAIITASGALFGVIIGGTITATVESCRQGKRDRLLMRSGVRLLREELSETIAALERTVHTETIRRQLLTEVAPSWESYRELLAGRLSTARFDSLADSISEGRRTRLVMLASFPSDDSVGRLSSLNRETAEASMRILADAVAQLRAI
jgi:hypothetical protein